MSQSVGFVVLEGGSEFTGEMASVDRRALTLCGGESAPIRIIPAAAAPDNNHVKAGGNGVRWFKALGASDVCSLGIVDPATADRPDLARKIETAKLIFILGGFPRHLAETLAGSRTWQAIVKALGTGAVLAGSSAGAMVLCEHYYDPVSGKNRKGLNLIPNAVVLPHHDTFGKTWVPQLAETLPGSVLIGIDEETAALNDGPAGEWTVYGKGAVTVHQPDGPAVFHPGQRFDLPIAVKDFI
jgi:cyanophycinase